MLGDCTRDIACHAYVALRHLETSEICSHMFSLLSIEVVCWEAHQRDLGVTGQPPLTAQAFSNEML